MIISASRRTDIPSYYSEWLINRFKEGYVLVRNPINIHEISKISLAHDVVDGIVFWTKNPIPMIDRLKEIKGYTYYFQFTLNSYGQDVEPNIPSKNDVIIPAFQKLSQEIGADKVIWRYDPIFITDKYTVEYHFEYFEKILKRLQGFTHRCTFSFLDSYRNTERNIKHLGIQPIDSQRMVMIAKELARISSSYGIKLNTCAEPIDFAQFDIEHAKCIDDRLFESLLGYKLNIDKDKNQRMECGCVASIDIGTYNTCLNGCKYCYANYSSKMACTNFAEHNPLSPLLFGELTDADIIKERKMVSCRNCQIHLFG